MLASRPHHGIWAFGRRLRGCDRLGLVWVQLGEGERLEFIRDPRHANAERERREDGERLLRLQPARVGFRNGA